MTDSELLRHYAREGKQEAFQEFVGRHVDLVYGAALRRLGGSVHRAQDVTQTVFTDAAKRSERLASHPAMTGWLYTSAYRAAAALMRAEDRRERREREVATTNQIDAMSGGKVAGLDTTLLGAIEHAVSDGIAGAGPGGGWARQRPPGQLGDGPSARAGIPLGRPTHCAGKRQCSPNAIRGGTAPAGRPIR